MSDPVEKRSKGGTKKVKNSEGVVSFFALSKPVLVCLAVNWDWRPLGNNTNTGKIKSDNNNNNSTLCSSRKIKKTKQKKIERFSLLRKSSGKLREQIISISV